MSEQVTDVDVSQLVFDTAYQMRADIPEISQYQAILESATAWPFNEPLVAYRIRGKIKIVDGFTRGRAAIAAGWKEVPVLVKDGSHADALRFAFGCNATHGFRRTNADKRKAVLTAIAHYRGDQSVSNAHIAMICKVSHTYVKNLIEQHTKRPEPEVQSKSPCPVCGVDQWIETSAGFTCSACQHVLGTPATQTGRRQPATSTTAPTQTRTYAEPPRRPAATPTAPAHTPTKAGSHRRIADEASTSLGQLIRALDQLGELETLRPHVTAIQKAIQRKRAR